MFEVDLLVLHPSFSLPRVNFLAMEGIQLFISQIENEIVDSFWTVAGYGFFSSFLGLALGILLVVVCNKRRLFKRDFKLWTFLVALNFVYIPLLMMGLGGVLGTVYGTHSVAKRWIEVSTEPVVSYAQGYLPYFQIFLNEAMEKEKGSGLTIETLVHRMVEEDDELRSDPIARAAVFQINLAIVNHITAEVAGFTDISEGSVFYEPGFEVIEEIKRIDITNINPEVFTLLPRTLIKTCDNFFFMKYVLIGGIFLPFMLFPVGELMLFALWRWVRKRVVS